MTESIAPVGQSNNVFQHRTRKSLFADKQGMSPAGARFPMRALHGLVLAQVAWLVVFILDGLHTVYAQTFQHRGVLHKQNAAGLHEDHGQCPCGAGRHLVLRIDCTLSWPAFMGPTVS